MPFKSPVPATLSVEVLWTRMELPEIVPLSVKVPALALMVTSSSEARVVSAVMLKLVEVLVTGAPLRFNVPSSPEWLIANVPVLVPSAARVMAPELVTVAVLEPAAIPTTRLGDWIPRVPVTLRSVPLTKLIDVGAVN